MANRLSGAKPRVILPANDLEIVGVMNVFDQAVRLHVNLFRPL